MGAAAPGSDRSGRGGRGWAGGVGVGGRHAPLPGGGAEAWCGVSPAVVEQELGLAELGERYESLRLVNPRAEKQMRESLERYGQMSPVVPTGSGSMNPVWPGRLPPSWTLAEKGTGSGSRGGAGPCLRAGRSCAAHLERAMELYGIRSDESRARR